MRFKQRYFVNSFVSIGSLIHIVAILKLKHFLTSTVLAHRSVRFTPMLRVISLLNSTPIAEQLSSTNLWINLLTNARLAFNLLVLRDERASSC